VFVSSEVGGEIAVLDDNEASANYRKMIARIDLCKSAKEPAPCNDESVTPLTTAFTPNTSGPHGIRWSKLTKKVYSIQEGYGEIAEIDPTTLAVTNTFDLAGLPYTSYGISADGRFLLLRGDTTPVSGTKLGVIDLGTAGAPRTDFIIPELAGTSPGAFKFSPDGKRFYILDGNATTATKKDLLFAFNSSTLTATPPSLTLLREIPLETTGAHGMDVLVQGAGEAKYVVVSNSTDNSISIINATDNQVKQKVAVGSNPGGVSVYASGDAEKGNQATASVTSNDATASSPLNELLDDHGMPE
jgi:YVTN family beta-propeller protein